MDRFNNIMIKLYDKHAPIRPVKLKHLPALCLTEEIYCIINKDHLLLAKCQTIKSNSNRNHCNKTLQS